MVSEFKWRYIPPEHDVVRSLNNLRKMHKSNSKFDHDSRKIIDKYLKSRNELIQKYNGEYVFVTADEIIPLRKTTYDPKSDRPNINKIGQAFKVGEEIESF